MNQSFSVSVNMRLTPNKSAPMEKRIKEEYDRVMDFLTKGNRKLKKKRKYTKNKKVVKSIQKLHYRKFLHNLRKILKDSLKDALDNMANYKIDVNNTKQG